MRWHVRAAVIADWLQALNAGGAIALIWSMGDHYSRWELTIWFGALISAVLQLQCYRRWLSEAQQSRDEYRDELRTYQRSWGR